MEYLADTVAIVRHLREHPALGPQAAQILRDADAGRHHVYLSAITLMEVLYLSEAKRVDVRLDDWLPHQLLMSRLLPKRFFTIFCPTVVALPP